MTKPTSGEMCYLQKSKQCVSFACLQAWTKKHSVSDSRAIKTRRFADHSTVRTSAGRQTLNVIAAIPGKCSSLMSALFRSTKHRSTTSRLLMTSSLVQGFPASPEETRLNVAQRASFFSRAEREILTTAKGPGN